MLLVRCRTFGCVLLLLTQTVPGIAQTQAPLTFPPDTPAAFIGSVVDGGGAGLAGAVASFERVFTPLPATSAPVRSVARADRQGAFQFANLAPGSYQVCVSVPVADFVGTCDWGSPQLVNLGAGEIRSARFTLARGTRLHIRIDDPEKLLRKGDVKDPQKTPSPEDPIVVPDISVGVARPRLAEFVAGDEFGLTFTALVPRGADVRVAFAGRKLLLVSPEGRPDLPERQTRTFRTAPTDTQRTIRVHARKLPR